MSTRLLTARWYRSRVFWLLLLVGLYTLLGTLVLPRIVDNLLKQTVDESLGWHTQIKEVTFNPFDFHLAVKGVEILDETDRKVAAFDSLILNVDTFALTEMALGFEVTELRRPYVLVEVYPGGKETNFGRAVRRQAAANDSGATTTSSPSEAGDASSTSEGDEGGSDNSSDELPRLRFDKIRIADADIEILDESQGERVEHRLSPLNLTLFQFATYHDRADRYQISIDFGHDQILSWKGVINMVSRQSKGTLALDNLQLARLTPYIKPYTDYRIPGGTLSFEFHYDIGVGANEALALDLSNASLKTEGLAVALGEAAPFVELSQLEMTGGMFNLGERLGGLDRVALEGLHLSARRDPQGQLAFLPPTPEQPHDPEKDASSDSERTTQEEGSAGDAPEPFRWKVGGVSLLNSRLDWRDETLSNPATFAVSDVNLRVRNLSDDLAASLPFELRLRPEDSGEIHLAGALQPDSGEMNANLTVDAFQLKTLQAYVNSVSLAQIRQGTLTLAGELALAPKSSELGQFKGRVALGGVDVAQDASGEALLSWQDVALEGVAVQFAPLVLKADEWVIDSPQVNLAINEQGQLNLGALSKAPAVSSADGAESPVTRQVPTSEKSTESGEKTAAAAPDIQIAKMTLRQGGLAFTDQTYEPAVDIELRDFEGEIVNLSSDPATRSKVDLRGGLGEYGKLTLKGSVNPLSEKLYTDMRVLLKRFDMTELSPYTGRYVGNVVEKGKMNLDLSYHIENDRLKAGNQVLLQKFSLGEAVKSEQATSLPVDLAIALLTDGQGQIDVDLPVEGDLTDPEFRVGKVILSALGNLITKAATSPFALIGGLVGESDGLDEVVFAPGISRLDEAQVAHLDQLAKALEQRPALGVEVKGLSDPGLDQAALQILRLNKRQEAIRASLGDNATEHDLLVALVTEAGMTSSLHSLPDPKVDADAYHIALKQLAQSTVKVEKSALRKLAARRAAAIQRQLVDGNGLEPDRVFVLDPVVKGQGSDTKVVIPLALHAM